MTTLPSTLAHQRSTIPQPWSEASQVMMTTWAAPVSPARKAACKELGTVQNRKMPNIFLICLISLPNSISGGISVL